MSDFPDDLQRAYETFVMLCTHYDFAVAGMAVRESPAGIFVIGNVTERGHEFAKLLREFADLVDSKIDAGKLVQGKSTMSDPSKVN